MSNPLIKEVTVGRVRYRIINDDSVAQSLLLDAERVALMASTPTGKTGTHICENDQGVVAVLYINSESDGGWMAFELGADVRWLREKANQDSNDARYFKACKEEIMDTILASTSNPRIINAEFSERPDTPRPYL